MDYRKQAPTGYVRMHNSATEVAKQFSESKDQLNGVNVTVRVLSGQEEEMYWNTIKAKRGRGSGGHKKYKRYKSSNNRSNKH